MIILLTDWWNALGGLQQVFWSIAIVFSLLFLIQVVLTLVGVDGDFDPDAVSEGGNFSIDPSFTLLSVRSVIAFFTFFGWAGVLALSKTLPIALTILVALSSGFAAMILVAYTMYFFAQLGEVGNINAKDFLFQTGIVYLSIPGRRKGTGKVHITIKNSLREMDAVTEGETLATGQSVTIVEVLDDQILVVEPVEIFNASNQT